MVTVQAVIAANRFGLGARPGELAEISDDHEGWLLAQLVSDTHAAQDQLQSSAEILREFQRLQRVSREARRSDSEERADAEQRAYRSFIRTQYQTQATRRYELAAGTDAPFRERLVHFWTNHFAVSADKQAVTPLVGTLEEEAIRPHVTGRFLDMLMAVEQHPAMLLYLDNQASMGDNSRTARAVARRGRDLGLNENLARVGLKHAAQDLHERALARAVFADDGQNFAAAQREVHAVQSQNAGKPFRDGPYIQDLGSVMS